MTTTALVNLWGTTVGAVSLFENSDVAHFEYDPDFQRIGVEVAPLTMPLSGREYSFPALPRDSFKGLPGLLADSLPDKFGNAVIDRWLDEQGRPRDSFNAVERLCYTGKRGMGALEFEPAVGPDATAAERIEVSELVKLAQDVLTQRAQARVSRDEISMQQILQVGTSAGGARAKAVIAWNPATNEIRSGQVDAGSGFQHWIMKLDGISANADKEDPDPLGYTNIEYAYYLMARKAGIEMSECRLFEEGGRAHFLTRRFDRAGESAFKLHMQTLGAIAHYDLNDAGSCSYEQAVSVMRQLNIGQDEVEQLFRRMIFNIVARNHDDHVKNISFLMDQAGTWRLSPAYDMTYAFNPGGAWTCRHQMSANGKLDDFSLEDIIETARHMSIPVRRANSIVADVVDASRSWFDCAEASGVPEGKAQAIERVFVNLK